VTARKKTARPAKVETQYFDMNGVAVVWEPGFLPRIEETDAYVHDLAKFGDEAQQVPRERFEQLRHRPTTRRGRR
jgi:hypothetical protein